MFALWRNDEIRTVVIFSFVNSAFYVAQSIVYLIKFTCLTRRNYKTLAWVDFSIQSMTAIFVVWGVSVVYGRSFREWIERIARRNPGIEEFEITMQL